MSLTPGSRLGAYEVTAQIGEGGMGQVYRAMDTTLGRQVAIKILPDAFAADPDRLARFRSMKCCPSRAERGAIAQALGFGLRASHAMKRPTKAEPNTDAP